MTRCKLVLALLVVAGCASDFSVKETSADSRTVDGVPVNNVVSYDIVMVSGGGPFAGLKGSDDLVLDLVDPSQILAVDVCRLLFGNATLKLELTPRQTIKTLTLESTPGAVAASKGAAAIATSAADIHKQSVDAKKAAKDAKK